MKIGIIGAGKVGCALAIGLKQKGFDIAGVYSRSEESVRLLCNVLGHAFENSMEKAVAQADLVFITVSDTRIGEVAEQMAENLESRCIRNKTFFHCSGALTSEVLKPLAELGGTTGSFHPIQTFADRIDGWKGLENICFGCEGPEQALKHAMEVVKVFHGAMLVVQKEDKPLYHAAACILSNYTVALAFMAENLFDTMGIDPDMGMKALMPLLKKTVENLGNYGSVRSLTGPVSRGDDATVDRHLHAIRNKTPQFEEVYKALARLTVAVSLQKGTIGNEAEEKLLNLLK